MKKNTAVFCSIILLFSLTNLFASSKDFVNVQKTKLPCPVYLDGESDSDLLFASSGWMGKSEAIEFDEGCPDRPHTGKCCIKFTFSDPKEWGGVAWQNPPNNWGDDEGGIDLTGARELEFWARGEKGGEKAEFSVGMVDKTKPYFDTSRTSLKNVRLSKDWKRYTIKLSGKDLRRIVTGFVVSVPGDSEPVVVYLDDIVFR